MSNVIPMEYDGQPVDFSADGWINATKVAKRFGKEPTQWLRQVETARYLVALGKALNMECGSLTELSKISELDTNGSASRTKVLRLSAKTGLVSVRAGANGGTWLHPKLAVHFARWLDVDFAVWCDLRIDDLLRGNVAPLEQYHRACKALNGRKELASAQGRGLAAWRFEKPALEHSVAYWLHELQMTLPLEDQQGGDQ